MPTLQEQIRRGILLTVLALSLALGVQAATIVVPAGGDLQAAINAAQPCDTIIVQADATYSNSFTLPNKSGACYITIQSSRASELPEGVRVGPAQSALFAKLQNLATDAAAPVISTTAGAHHYKFIGIEISTATSAKVYDIVRLGTDSQTASEVPHDLIFDRSYIHGFPTQEVQRGISLNGAEVTVSNSYISEIHGTGYDTQALCGWNGPGPFHIINNYLEAAGENVMFGGSTPSITNLIPSNIEIRRNYFFKPLTWKVGDPSYTGIHWSIKNLLEFKNARNVIVDGNVLENSWTDAQIGYCFLATVRSEDGRAPWATIENVTVTNNTFRGCDQVMQLQGSDAPNPSGRGNNLLLANNLFTNIANRFLTMSGFYNVKIDHNTHLQSGNNFALYGEASSGFIYTNNLSPRSGFGYIGDGTSEGNPTLSKYTPDAVFIENVVPGALATIYPAGNKYPATWAEVQLGADFQLAATSPFKNSGADGKDPGADMVALLAAQSAPVAAPAPLPSPTPTPVPSPSPQPIPAIQVGYEWKRFNFVLTQSQKDALMSMLAVQGYNSCMPADKNWSAIYCSRVKQ